MPLINTVFASGFALLASASLADAQVVTSQGVTTSPDASTLTVNAAVGPGNAGVTPVILTVDQGWSIDASSITGTLSLDGLPLADPAATGVVNFLSLGESAASVCSCAAGIDAGAITVDTSASISATNVTGAAGGARGLFVSSQGASGIVVGGNGEFQSDSSAGNSPFNGTAGGAVSVDLTGGSIEVDGIGSGGASEMLSPTMVGISASSLGGTGTSGYYFTGEENTPNPFYGDGGAGGAVNVTTAAGTSISVTQSGAGSNAVGIYAVSQGGAPGSFLGEIQGDTVYDTGIGGSAGTVEVTHGGSIVVDAPLGAGIFAISQGGNGNLSDVPGNNPDNLSPPPGAPGDGGTVTVEVLGTGSIDMKSGGIGVVAISQAGGWDPFGLDYQPSGGDVMVTVDSGATISTGDGGSGSANPFSFGVLALSTGNPLVTQQNFGNLAGAGTSGSITVTNDGFIDTNGELAIGIAALSIGGLPMIATAESGTNTVGMTGTTAGASGNEVTVTNSGSITTLGSAASGIVAISSGGGGIVKNDAPATTVTNGDVTSWTAGTSVGANTDSDAPATDGAAVTITNSGSITTGDGLGGGVASLGIIAQSIGGSGGTVGGVSSLKNLGGTGGGGGDGGDATVYLNAGSAIETNDKNANAILVQSIGGGGGNGANASGGFTATGGTGGAGGSGGTAEVTTSGTGSVTTNGNYSAGMVVQSIGGGGGNGGYADTAGAFVSVAIGGTGGAGGEGGTAEAYNNAGSSIATRGNNSAGMIVQSIGGGGGTGGGATSYSAGILFSVSVAVGGTGGDGGNGYFATGINHGSIVTGVAPGSLTNESFVANTGMLYGTLTDGRTIDGDLLASGALANGVLSGTLTTLTLSDGTVVENVTVSGTTITGTTSGGTPFTATLQNGGILHAVAANSSSDVVNGLLMLDGTINTDVGGPNPNGADSAGIIVQSIGGGGGNGGSASAKSLVLPLPGAKQAGVNLPTISFTTALGGAGGAGNDGGGVTAGNYNGVTTYGDGSVGMLAQSIGGGGGNGGDATAASTAIQSSGIDFQLTLGNAGDGGGAASGGTVTAFNGTTDESENGTITTYGQNAAGIMAQSIGGGGGNGGVGNAGGSTPPVHYSTGKSFAPTIGVGGSGGSGGAGGEVDVYNYAGSAIQTFGSTSQAIIAQSIGGGGGVAGGGSASGTGDTLSFDVAVGGSGAVGGDGGLVTVDNDGTLSTWGGDSTGILAQSIGGGGGAGGTSDAYASATASVLATVNNSAGVIQNTLTLNPFYTATLTIGGSGGGGGDGGMVDVTNTAGAIDGDTWTAGILTRGSRAYGVLAQSIGGGGGLGGTATGDSRSALVTEGSEDTDIGTPHSTITVGSGGGQSGSGGSVTVGNSGVIATRGYGSHAIVAQVIGGGGGVGADGSVDTDVSMSLGSNITDGIGAAAGAASSVTVENDAGAGLVTTGRAAAGIVAQSIGGGGGIASAGVDSFETVGSDEAGTAVHDFNLGGGSAVVFESGGVPFDPPLNSGGSVTVDHSGQILTYGDWSAGIIAQSIGSGGGIASIYATDSVDAEVNMFVGSTVDAWGAGGSVTIALGDGGSPSSIVTGAPVTVDGTVSHAGFGAFGILAQSIGDGGGLAIDDSSYVSNPCAGSSDADCRSMTVGGNGGDDGGAVTLEGNAVITTYGDVAHAVVLQSIGGGGGIGGQGRTLTDDSPAPTDSLSLQLGYLPIPATGNGGAVTLQATLDITTYGQSAYGIVAQSLNGGGLVFAQSGGAATIGPQTDDFTVGGGIGGDVVVQLDSGSSITTHGDGAIAILAQSIGYGGGVAGYVSDGANSSLSFDNDFNRLVTFPSSEDALVTVDVDADILTTGALAHGIFVQSLAGGGGLIADGSSQIIAVNPNSGWLTQASVNQSGSIITTGANSLGIFTETDGAALAITVTVNGSVQGGSGEQGHGVWIDGGYQGSSYENSLVVNSGGWVSSLSGNAVTFTTNGGTVENYGSVVGSVENGFIFNYGTYYTNGTDVSVLPSLFFNEGGRIGLSPSYRGGPTELTTAITGDVPVAYQVDTGTVFTILTDNSYTGGTTLAGGVVATNSNGAFSSGDIVVINPTAEIRTTSDTDLTIANNVSLAQTLTLSTADADSSLTMSGIITGTGGISTAGPGEVVLSGNNSYAGPTSVGGGTLVAGTATAISSGPLAIAAGATFDVNGFAYSFESLSGAGTLTSSSGSPALTLGAEGVVYKFDGVVDSGIGAVTFDSGTAILTGANAYTGGTTLAGGPTAIVLGNDQALSTGPITVNASYAYFYTVGDNPITLANDIQLIQPLSVSTNADGPSLTLTGTISGDGALYKWGTGVVTLAGNSAYAGNTYVDQGTLRAGSSTGFDAQSDFILNQGATLDLAGYDNTIGSLSGTGTVTNSATGTATLTVGATNQSSVFAGSIVSDGDVALHKVGSGVLILAGANNYGGGTLIEEGAIGVANAAALGLGDVTNNAALFLVPQQPQAASAAATLASLPASGVINVVGNYVQGDNGTLMLGVYDGGDGFDRFHVGGTAQLDGTLLLDVMAPVAPGAGKRLEAFQFDGTVSGTFDQALTTLPTVLAEFDGAGVTLKQGSFAGLQGADFTRNQTSVAAYLDRNDKAAMSDAFSQVVGELNAMSVDSGTLADHFSHFSSGAFAGFVRDTVFNDASFQTSRFASYMQNRRAADGSFLAGTDMVDTSALSLADTTNPLADMLNLGGAGTGSAGGDDGVHIYVQGGGIFGRTSASADMAGRDVTTGTVTFGADTLLSPHVLAGLFFRYSHSIGSSADFSGDVTMDVYEPGIYAGFVNGGWYLNALASFGFNNMSENRYLGFDADNVSAKADPNGTQQTVNLDAGYDFHIANWTLGPTLGAQYVHLTVDGFNETGAPGLNLSVYEQQAESLRSRVGVHVLADFAFADMRMKANLNLNWQHEFLDPLATVTARFQSVGTDSFTVTTAAAGRDALELDAGLNAEIAAQTSAFFSYSLMAGSGSYFGQSVQGGLKVSF